MAEITLDCGGLACPTPIVRISQAMKQLKVGDTLLVTAQDAAFGEDVRAWCSMIGHELVTLEWIDGRCRARIRKTQE